MRIAQVSPPWEAVPPNGYGGTERVVHYLTEQLVAFGHQVTLFASGDSRTSAELVPVVPKALRASGVKDGTPHVLEELDAVRARCGDFDIIHCHVDYLAFPFARELGCPVVHTIHGRLDIPELAGIYRRHRDQPLISISDSQRTPLPDQNWIRTIYHGLPLDLYRWHDRPSDYALFLGRMSMEKRPDWAIEIAARAGVRLIMAAKVDPNDQAYFDEVVRPLLDRSDHVEFIGEVDDSFKNDLIGNAVALIMPVDWPEPFGLTAIEALACGTPVITRPCGAIPEIITDGVDGYVREDIDELARLLTNINDISREQCRATFERRFTDTVMTKQYVDAYDAIAGGKSAPRAESDPWTTIDTALAASIPKNVLKGNHAYAVVDPFGDIPERLRGEFGFYNRGTRFISRFDLRLNGKSPCLLGSGYEPESDSIIADLGNEAEMMPDGCLLQQNSIHLRRELRIDHDVLRQTLSMTSFADLPIEIALSLEVASDFADMFEVRGTKRKQRGELLGLTTNESNGGGSIEYIGLDGVPRAMKFRFETPYHAADGNRFVWNIRLEPGARWSLDSTFDGRATEHLSFRALGHSEKAERWSETSPHIETNDEILTNVIQQSVRDLGALMSTGVDGVFPTAGIPWYATLFGRDSIVTALQLIPWRVDTAISTFFTLAHYQADAYDDFTDSEPGKILHEWREGEMANLREIPFIPYYGTIDATLLFIHLAYEIHAITADGGMLSRMWPHLCRAFEWIEKYGSLCGDELIDYRCRSNIGLRNQGWKDSWDSISHRDGTLAEAPIALVEVQAYAVMALHEFADLARGIDDERAQRALERAEAIRSRVEREFWMEDESCYGIALDRDRRLCRIVTSNSGHAPFSGLPDERRARLIARRLLAPDMFCGFGIRTLSSRAKRYNPMSYHNGSVWPHDNALIAEGLRRYGFVDEMAQVHRDLFAAICSFPLRRVPELFCGFGRDMVRDPVPYSTACAPQAWASGTVLMFLRQMLNIRYDAISRSLRYGPAVFPPGVEWISVRGLRIGSNEFDFTVSSADISSAQSTPARTVA